MKTENENNWSLWVQKFECKICHKSVNKLMSRFHNGNKRGPRTQRETRIIESFLGINAINSEHTICRGCIASISKQADIFMNKWRAFPGQIKGLWAGYLYESQYTDSFIEIAICYAMVTCLNRLIKKQSPNKSF